MSYYEHKVTTIVVGVRDFCRACCSTPAIADFAQPAAAHVINKSAHCQFFWDPGVGAQFLQLVPYVFFNVLEGVEERRRNRGGSGAVLDSCPQVLLAGVHQAAVGVVDDHDLFRAQQVMRYHQRAQAVVGHDAAGIADNMGISGLQSQGANRKPGIHARQDGKLARRARSQCAQFVGAGVNFVGFQDFINHAHVCHSVTKQLPVASVQRSQERSHYQTHRLRRDPPQGPKPNFHRPLYGTDKEAAEKRLF